MTNQTPTPSAPKPVKAWALLNPKGEYLGIRFTLEDDLWHLAFEAYRSKEDRPRRTFSQVRSLVKSKGYRCIPVLITHL